MTSAAAATGVVIAVLYNWKGEPQKRNPSIIDPLILSSFCDEQTLRSIGESYRNLTPEENSKEKLLNLLTSGLNMQNDSLKNVSAAVNKLELNIEKEFKEINLVTIKGWIISRTEARQCALLSLS